MTSAPPKTVDDGWELSWRLDMDGQNLLQTATDWPGPVPESVWGDGSGRGVRVCVLDSGVEPDHPLVGPIQGRYAVTEGEDGVSMVTEDDKGDACGHGTACAGIIRSIAPECEIISVRVLGLGFFGSGDGLVAGLRWAIENDMHVINMSLSTTKREIAQALQGLTDLAYFRRRLIVASAHNNKVASFPWRFASVISVGSHREPDPGLFLYNPRPPVEFFARGERVPVAWLNGGRSVCSGNSFATPHITGLCARILGSHPDLAPYQVKTLLHLTAANVGGEE
jgi:subtilisin family serine protease